MKGRPARVDPDGALDRWSRRAADRESQPGGPPVPPDRVMRRWIPRLLARDPLDLPVMILQGEQDLTVDWEWNLAILEEKFPDAQIYRHPEARHHLVNEAEPIRRALFDALDAFVDRVAHAKSAAAARKPPES